MRNTAHSIIIIYLNLKCLNFRFTDYFKMVHFHSNITQRKTCPVWNDIAVSKISYFKCSIVKSARLKICLGDTCFLLSFRYRNKESLGKGTFQKNSWWEKKWQQLIWRQVMSHSDLQNEKVHSVMCSGRQKRTLSSSTSMCISLSFFLNLNIILRLLKAQILLWMQLSHLPKWPHWLKFSFFHF